MAKRILITGAAGFLGSHLTDRFLREGYEVIGMDNLLTGSMDNIAHLNGVKEFTFFNQNVSESVSVDAPLDYILHFASPASPPDYMRLPIDTMKVGSYAVFNLMELAKEKGARILVASTSEIYGDPEVHPQTEEYWGNVNTIGPRSVYDEAKRFMETITMAYHNLYGVETRIIRIFNTYGPRMALNDGRALPNFMCQALRGEDVTLYGDGSQTRSFCYVDDLVDGIYRLLLGNYHLPVNMGNPVEITLKQFAEEIIALTGSGSKIIHMPLPKDDPKQRQPNITKAREILGWEPKVDRAEGLRRTLEDFKQRVLIPSNS